MAASATFERTTTLTNSTVSGNSGSGGGIYISGGTTTLTNATVVGNTTSPGGAAISTQPRRHAEHRRRPRQPLRAERHAQHHRGQHGAATTSGGINGTNANNLTAGYPLLAPLGNYGGPRRRARPSPAPPRSTRAARRCSATDQRGLARPVNANCDIGAVESRGFVFSNPTGSGQSTTNGSAFPTALGVTVTGNIATGSIREPVDGGVVSFTGPVSGASIAPNPTTATIPSAGAISDGVASASVTANSTAGGPYTVTASASGTTGTATYSLTNITVSCVVTSKADSGAGSLRARVDTANAGGCTGATITFQSGLAGPITLTSDQIALTKNVTITGPGVSLLTVARSTVAGTPKFRIFRIDPGVTASITGITVTGGDADMGDGGGIRSQGNLALTNVVVQGNRAGNNGGGIEHNSGGTLTLTSVTLGGNTALGSGGGLNVYAAAVNGTNVTINGNNATIGGSRRHRKRWHCHAHECDRERQHRDQRRWRHLQCRHDHADERHRERQHRSRRRLQERRHTERHALDRRGQHGRRRRAAPSRTRAPKT